MEVRLRLVRKSLHLHGEADRLDGLRPPGPSHVPEQRTINYPQQGRWVDKKGDGWIRGEGGWIGGEMGG